MKEFGSKWIFLLNQNMQRCIEHHRMNQHLDSNFILNYCRLYPLFQDLKVLLLISQFEPKIVILARLAMLRSSLKIKFIIRLHLDRHLQEDFRLLLRENEYELDDQVIHLQLVLVQQEQPSRLLLVHLGQFKHQFDHIQTIKLKQKLTSKESLLSELIV